MHIQIKLFKYSYCNFIGLMFDLTDIYRYITFW